MRKSIVLSVLAVAWTVVQPVRAEVTITGGKLAKFTDSGGLVRGFVKASSDPALASPPSPLCPVPSFVQLRTSAQDNGLIPLNCGWWSHPGTTYKYSDASALSGGVQSIQLKSGKLKIKLTGQAFTAIHGPVSWIEARLMIGGTSYCARFEVIKRNAVGYVMAKGPTTDCEILPTPTASSTPTTTVTATATSSRTPSNTPTNTNTKTATPTASGTPTFTYTFTATGTATRTQTNTATVTATSTPTRTATRTNTPTPTRRPHVHITSPSNGIFTTASSIAVTGEVTDPVGGTMNVTVNGSPVTLQPNNTFSTSVALSAPAIFNPILAELTTTGTFRDRDRVVVIRGSSVADGGYSPSSIALRINDTGFNKLEQILKSMVNLNVASLIPPGTRIISGYCALDSPFGCIVSVDVDVVSVDLTGYNLDINSMTGFVDADITLDNIAVRINIHGGIFDCDYDVTSVTTDIDGHYDLQPMASDHNKIDVIQQGGVAVSFSGFSAHATSGICDFPVIGDLISLAIGDIEPTVRNALQNFLNAPNGSGDPPIAAAIQSALGGLDIAGPLGMGLGVNLDAPFFGIFEDTAGVTLGSDTSITASMPAAGAPDFSASYSITGAFPSFGATTPVTHQPYDMAICIAGSAFNQLLKAEVESGLLQIDLSSIDLGTGPVQVTAGLLSAFIPEFSSLPPNTPMTLQVRPTIAPIVTGNAGPNGELTELKIAQLMVNIVSGSTLYLGMAADLDTGFDLTFDGSGLVPALSPAQMGGLTVVIVNNPIGTNPVSLETLLPSVLGSVLPTLSDSIGSFPIPSFLGITLQGVEVSRNGQFISIYANLTQ
jgi:hypothetical protein